MLEQKNIDIYERHKRIIILNEIGSLLNCYNIKTFDFDNHVKNS